MIRILFFILLFPTLAHAQLDDICRSTCKVATTEIRDGKNYFWHGSGTFIKENDQYFYVLTAGHVTNKGPYYNIFLTYDGYEGGPYKAIKLLEVCTKDPEKDIAVLRVKKGDITYGTPRISPLDFDSVISPKDKAFTWGHPEGGFGTGFNVQIKEHKNKIVYYFPGPLVGRSGSGLFNRHGLIGLVVRGGPGYPGEAIYIKDVMEIIKTTNKQLYDSLK